MSRNRVALMHEITVLYNWASDERDTISLLSENQAKRALEHLKKMWTYVERRRGSK